MMFSFAAPAIALLGAALLTLGLRGRRVDLRPRCASCRFDLTGLVARDEHTSARCPECGAVLQGLRGVRYGTRRRMPRLATLGGAVLLAAPPD